MVNLTKARAMLLQKIKADSEIAKAAVRYYLKSIEAYQIGTVSVVPKDPIEIGIEECKNFLCERFGQDTIQYTESELLEKVCVANRQVERYVKAGVSKRDYFDKSSNKKARYILERLRVRYAEVAIVAKRPVTLKWMPESVISDSDHNDHNDLSCGEGGGSNKNETESTVKGTIPKNENVESEHESGQNQVGVSLQDRSNWSKGQQALQLALLSMSIVATFV